MELAPGGVVLSCEVTFDQNDLHVGMSVYDDTGADPVLILGPFAMDLVAINTYRGKFTGVVGHNYIVIKAVYTDIGLTMIDTNYSQGSESIVAQSLSGGSTSTGCEVVGLVDNNPAVVGYVVC